MSVSTRQFQAWVGLGPTSANGRLELQEIEVKPFTNVDVDVEITHSSIDGSDLHVLRSGWFPTSYPAVAGHEFVGKIIRAGEKVSNVKVGDRVGIGGTAGACLLPDCKGCGNDMEQHCSQHVPTYNGWLPGGDKTFGGFAHHWRGDGRFVFKIPDPIPSNEAAPMMCGGVTMYAPMKQHGVGPGKRVGIIGIGGLGHFGLLFARALEASSVVAISRTDTKKADALKLGADEFVSTDDAGWEAKHAKTLDLLLCTVSSNKMPLSKYLGLLDVGGVFVQIGAPEDVLPEWSAPQLCLNRISIRGSYLGSRTEIREMLDLVARKQIHPWVEDRPLTDINQALIDFGAGKPRYRIVLHN